MISFSLFLLIGEIAQKEHLSKVKWALAILRGHSVIATEDKKLMYLSCTAGRTGLGPMTSREINLTVPYIRSMLSLDVTGNIIARR